MNNKIQEGINATDTRKTMEETTKKIVFMLITIKAPTYDTTTTTKSSFQQEQQQQNKNQSTKSHRELSPHISK